MKDPVLKGIYVKRCKCGNRPYYDRNVVGGHWIACNCGKQSITVGSKTEAVNSWNSNRLDFS